MKKLLLSLIAATGICAGASAQEAAPSMIQGIYTGYNLYTISPKDAANLSLSGVTFGYQVDFRVSESLPLYVGTGLDLRCDWGNKTEFAGQVGDITGNFKNKYSFYNLNLPLNVSVRAPLSNGFYLTPMVGLNLRVQLSGKNKVEMNGVEISDVNLFDSDDMGGGAFNRVQFGWHAGVKLNYQQFFVGAKFGTDFTKLHKNVGASSFLVTLGMNF